MFRWLAVLVVLAGGTFALMTMLVGTQTPSQGQGATAKGDSQSQSIPDDPEAGEAQQPAPSAEPNRPLPPIKEFAATGSPTLWRAVIIPNCKLATLQQQDVPSQKEGVVLFIGTEVKPGEQVPPEELVTPDPLFGFLAVQAVGAKAGDPGVFSFPNDPSKTLYRRWQDQDVVEPNGFVMAREPKRIRRLQEGMWVNQGDLVALVNPAVAYSELDVAASELKATEAERAAAVSAKRTTAWLEKSYADADARLPGSIPRQDIMKARQEAEKAIQDERVKDAALRSAKAKLNKAATTLQMYEVRASISGRVKTIYKNTIGEAVKPLDPLLQIQNPKLLRVEGRLEVQDALKLSPGMIAEVEATRPEPPQVLSGHLGPVTCVAVSNATKPVVVSGGDDFVLRGWDPVTGQQRWYQNLFAAPSSLACTPPGAKGNLVVCGDAAGVVHILDLDHLGEPARKMAERHQGAVLSVAFSPDGSVCVTGGADRTLCLWEVETGKILHRVPMAHRHEVTAVQFAGAGRVVSADRGGGLVIWEVPEGKRLALKDEIKGRGSELIYPGVSPDGKHVLFDQGRELRLLTLDGQQIEGRLINPSDTATFSGMALYSPDGKTILTNGSAPGRLQLWRAPTATTRAAELRQFIWSSAQATCAAFAPDGTFAVTGTQDHRVLLWAMPSPKEVEARLSARLTLVEKSLESKDRQVRVWAVVENPDWLIPGGQATMVIPPQPAPLPVR
jgi:WD40 repeat protein